MSGHRLVTGQRLVMVAVCVRQSRLAASGSLTGAEIEINRHSLPRARWRVVKGEDAVNPGRIVALGAVSLPDAEGEGLFVFLQEPHVTEIHFQLARKEELMGRRKKAHRAVPAFDDGEAIAGA